MRDLEQRIIKLEELVEECGVDRMDATINTLGEVLGRLSVVEGRVQNLELAFSRLTERLRALEVQHCEDCNAEIPHGQGLGFSVPDTEWTDKSKPRGIILTPLCKSCMSKRLSKPKQEESSD